MIDGKGVANRRVVDGQPGRKLSGKYRPLSPLDRPFRASCGPLQSSSQNAAAAGGQLIRPVTTRGTPVTGGDGEPTEHRRKPNTALVTVPATVACRYVE
jgi:hypothetical protein